MQLLELWQMAKLVLKQSVKAHGSLVYLYHYQVIPCVTLHWQPLQMERLHVWYIQKAMTKARHHRDNKDTYKHQNFLF